MPFPVNRRTPLSSIIAISAFMLHSGRRICYISTMDEEEEEGEESFFFFSDKMVSLVKFPYAILNNKNVFVGFLLGMNIRHR